MAYDEALARAHAREMRFTGALPPKKPKAPRSRRRAKATRQI